MDEAGWILMLPKNRIKTGYMNKSVSKGIVSIILFIASIIMFFPFVVMFITSLKTMGEIIAPEFIFFPKD